MSNNEKYIVKKCERAEYDDFLLMINKAFGYDGDWFQQNVSHCVPNIDEALDCEIAKHYITVCDGEVVGAVGAYPLEWVVSEDRPNGWSAKIKSFGIGQVSCKKEMRGTGIMTNMLKQAINDMINDGALIGFLGGDRHRYCHFGFDIGGNSVELHFNRYRFASFASTEGLTVRKAELRDCELIEEMYTRLPSYIVRDERNWEKLFKRPNYTFYIGELCEEGKKMGEKGSKRAYMCVSDSDTVVEIQGNPDAAKSLILWLMGEKDKHGIKVLYPLANFTGDALYAELWKTAGWVNVEPIDMAAVYEPGKLLDIVAPAIINQGYGEYLADLDESGKKSLLKKLFGLCAAPLPPEISAFSGIRPLVFWLPQVNNL